MTRSHAGRRHTRKPCWYYLPAVETSLLLLGCGVIVSLSVYSSSGTGTSECSDVTIDPRTRFRIFNKANVPPVRSWAIDHAQLYSARIGDRLDRSQSYDQAGRDRCLVWGEERESVMVSVPFPRYT